MKPSRAFEISCGAFLVGVALASFVVFPPIWSITLSILGTVLLVIGFLFSKKSFSSWFLMVALFFIASTLGIFRFSQSDEFDRSLGLRAGETVDILGTISDEPDVRQDTTHLTVDVVRVDDTPSHGRALVIAERYPEFHYGEAVSIHGKIQKPSTFDAGGGRQFDYEAYLANDEISVLFVHPTIEKVSDAPRSLQGFLFSIKHRFLESLGKILPEPHASFLAGILVGVKHALGDEWLARFRDVGLIHVVVLSGYNITIVADFVLKIFSFIPLMSRSLLFSLGGFSIVLFAIMVGGSSTVIRAAVMALIVILAKATGRTYGVKRALLIAAVAMVAWKPRSLMFDASFELSFLATIALIYVSPIIEARIKILENWPIIKSIFISTISTQIIVLPLILYKIGVASLIAPITNLIILPLIPLTMILGFLAGIVGMLTPIIATPFAFSTYVLTGFELAVVKWFSEIPFAAFSVPAFSSVLLVLSYLILVLAFIKLRRSV